MTLVGGATPSRAAVGAETVSVDSACNHILLRPAWCGAAAGIYILAV
jgi:hypothetical protein